MSVEQGLESIADYKCVRRLGRGNHGEFYLAVPPPRLALDKEYVAVKVLPRGTSDEGFRRATRELRLFAAVDSPYVVRVFDAGQEGDNFYYSIEYFPLGSLGCPSRPLLRSEVLRAVLHAALAAHALHEVGVVHRDIKPANVLLHEDGAKLSDLGLGQMLSPGLTMTSMGPVESVEYLDPDVLRGAQASRASDIWSLGVTLNKSLTGAAIYSELPGNDPILALRTVLGAEPLVGPGLSPDEERLIRWCLETEPGKRPSTAELVAQEIGRFDSMRGS